MSHPSWVRGLKQVQIEAGDFGAEVAPFMGAWIETTISIQNSTVVVVAPFMGAWIETLVKKPHLLLKQSRTLHGCVD